MDVPRTFLKTKIELVHAKMSCHLNSCVGWERENSETYIENPVFAKFEGTFPDIPLKEASLLFRTTFELAL